MIKAENSPKIPGKFPKKFAAELGSAYGGPASPERGVFLKNFSQGGILAIPPCTPLMYTVDE